MVIKENFGTVVGEDAGHPHPFWSYIPFLFQRMAPWSLFFPALAVFLYRERHRLAERELLYFVVWAATVLIFFSAFSQKRTVYILAAYPAIALLFGAWCQSLMKENFSGRQLFMTRLAGYLSAASFVILSAMLILQFTNHKPLDHIISGLHPKEQADLTRVAALLAEHRIAVLAWAALCGTGAILSILAVRKNVWRRFVECTAVLMIVSFFSVQYFGTEVAREYSFKPFIMRVVGIIKDAPLFFYCSEDYPVMFYAGRHIHRYQPTVASSPFYMLVWQNEWDRIKWQTPLSVIATSESTDRASPKQGHLLLVEVTDPEVFALAHGQSSQPSCTPDLQVP